MSDTGSEPKFDPQDPEFEPRVRSSFKKQTVMHTLGAQLTRVGPGEVDIVLPFRHDLTQQHGFLHAGVIATVLDSACGYAAFSLMPPGTGVLSIEYKINMLAPARGERFIARGWVKRAGRTVTVTQGDALAIDGAGEKIVATMQATMMTIRDREDVVD